jgi:ketosteroid isomerase-like protein
MVLFAACLLASMLVQEPNAAAAPADGATELARLETVWNDAHTHADANALDRLWADDLLVVVPRMPVMRKVDAVGMMRSGRMTFRRYETSDLNIRIYGDAAVVTGRLRRSRLINDRPVDDNWQFTKVYIRNSGQWRVVSFHASESPQ